MKTGEQDATANSTANAAMLCNIGPCLDIQAPLEYAGCVLPFDLPEDADVFKQRKHLRMTTPGNERENVVRVSDLARGKTRTVEIVPDAGARDSIAADLGLLELRKLRLEGRLAPFGRRDWRFEGHLGATVVQPCVVTLAPVVTRLEEAVLRSFVAEWQTPEGDEVELPEDVDTEPLGAEIDLGAIMVEALALALPAWPRTEGADLDTAVFTEPGQAPMRDEDARPFAGLASLRDKLTKDDGET